MLCDFRTAEVRGDELHSGVATLLIQAVSAQAQPRPVSVAAAGKVIDDAMVSTIATCPAIPAQPFLARAVVWHVVVDTAVGMGP